MSEPLHVDLTYRRQGFDLECAETVAPGTITGVIGPNGAGKTTLLDLVCGLIVPAAGVVRVGDRVWDDGAAGLHLPTHRRTLGRVFADHLLFAHLDVLGNLGFGLPRPRRSRVAGDWVKRLDLGPQARRRPHQLSHGQSQRVALGRALAPRPAVLLLDEPLAALDAGIRMRMRTLLIEQVRETGAPTLMVTHDPLDALICSDRLVVLEAGRVCQAGTAAEIARAPRSEYVAALVGLNLVHGVQQQHTISVAPGVSLTAAGTGSGPVTATFAPAAVALYPQRPTGSPRNVWQGRVAAIEPRAELARVRVEAGPPGLPSVLADLTAAAVAELRLGTGTPVWVSVKATEIASQPR